MNTREETLEQELIEAHKIIKRQSERIADLEMKDAVREQNEIYEQREADRYDVV